MPQCNDVLRMRLAPLRPELAAIAAGRLFLQELDRLAGERASFAFESTLSGPTYVARLKRWRALGYRVEIVYLRLSAVRLALRRIAARVRQDGHAIPRADVIRRFARSRAHFEHTYRPLADRWSVYDNFAAQPRLLERGP